ncbi:MAG TPA: holin [Candidatus Evtepia faecigallinarum]|nr:holin [Candidatus Evtepia faecigallinarum]
MRETWKIRWQAAAIRAVKTMAQTAVGCIGAAAALGDVNWPMVGSASVLAGLVSLLTNVAGLPEVELQTTGKPDP